MSQPTPTYALHRQFADFDQLAEETRQWNLDLRQLDCGEFYGELLQFGVGDVHLTEARFSRTLVQSGGPPEGLRTIGVPANRDVRLSWHGKRVCGDDLLIFARNAELAASSFPDFHVYTCSFPENLLSSIAERLRMQDLDELCSESAVIRCETSAMRLLRSCLRKICMDVRNGQLTSAESATAQSVTCELPSRLLNGVATGHAYVHGTIRKREHALNRAEWYISQAAHNGITVRDICREAQVSQRTLEYAFNDRFGVTPKAFLTAYRLNGIRRQLRCADPAEHSVVDIANSWSIWHMGQFAADYRRHFGELPSETLRRVHD